jgi:protein canopy 1/2
MDDYAKAKYKTNGKLTVLKMFLDGAMNPLMSGRIIFKISHYSYFRNFISEVDFVQDQDLNKSLKHYCLEVLDEFDELFLEYFMAEQLSANVVEEICLERTKICASYNSGDDDDDDEEAEDEPNLPEKEL